MIKISENHKEIEEKYKERIWHKAMEKVYLTKK